MKNLMFAAGTALALSAGAATKTIAPGEVHTATDSDVADYDTYEVQAASDGQAAGLLLLDLSVTPSVTLTGGGEVRKVSSATWTYNGTTKEQTSFAGRFVIASGIVQFDNGTTAAALGGGSSTPVVTNGATMVWNTSSLAYSRMLHLSGRGAKDGEGNDLGAFRLTKQNGSTSGLNRFSLDGDALMVITCNYLFLGGSGASKLNGHKLEKSGPGIVYAYGGSLTGDEGAFELSAGKSGSLTRLHIRENYNFGTATDGPLVLNDYTYAALQNDAKSGRPLVVKGAQSAIIELSNQYKTYATTWTEDTRYIGGPITLEDGAMLTARAPNAEQTPRSLSLKGKISGAGGITASGSGRVYVSNPENDFTGTLTVDGVSGGETYLASSSVLPDYSHLTVKNAGRVTVPFADAAAWPASSVAALAAQANWQGTGNILALDFGELTDCRRELSFADFTASAGGAMGFGAEGVDPSAELTVLGPVLGWCGFGAWSSTLRFAGDTRYELGTLTAAAAGGHPAGTVLFDGATDVWLTTSAPAMKVGSVGGGRVVVKNSNLCIDKPELIGLPGTPATRGLLAVCYETGASGLLDICEGSVVTGRIVVGYGNEAKAALRVGGGELVAFGSRADGSAEKYGEKSYVGSGNGQALLDVTGGTFRCFGHMAVGGWSPGIIRQTGGEFLTERHPDWGATSEHPFVNLPNSAYQGDFYQSNGVTRINGWFLFRGNGDGYLTLDGPESRFWTAQAIQGGYNSTASAYHMQVNMNAGVLECSRFGFRYAESEYKYPTPMWINFDGGTFKPTSSGEVFTPTRTGGARGVARVTVYGNGATIDNAYDNSTGQPLQSAPGNGVAEIVLPDGLPLTGYATMPSVRITGAGCGASAVAVYDLDAQAVTGFRVTCPGWDYADGGTKAEVVVGRNVTATLDCRVERNGNAGSLTKRGRGVLTLTDANTYGGDTVLAGGTLKCGADGAIPAGSRVVLAGGTLNMNGKTTGDGDALPKSWGVDVRLAQQGLAGTYDTALFADGATLTVSGADALPDPETAKSFALLTLTGANELPQPAFAQPVAEGWRIAWVGRTLKAIAGRGTLVILR